MSASCSGWQQPSVQYPRATGVAPALGWRRLPGKWRARAGSLGGRADRLVSRASAGPDHRRGRAGHFAIGSSQLKVKYSWRKVMAEFLYLPSCDSNPKQTQVHGDKG